MELNKKQKELLFETLLSYAVKESVIKEINEMPTEEQIKENVHFSATFENKMKKLINKQKHKRIIKSAYVYSKKIAVFVSIIISIGFGTLMTAEAVQKAVITTVVEWYEDHNGFIFENTSNKSNEEILNESQIKLPAYIPEAFELSESEDYDSFKLYVYKNEEGKNLVFNAIVVTDKNETFIDNEYTDYEIIEINGKETYLFMGTEDDYMSIIWTDGNVLYDISTDRNLIEIIRMAKSMK
ncbi:MAG: DUF4367 domain-containing protein [Sedimentibacter saalensis]|uniref:DUF4367 domain-containing protein n=1 Tax=Sedimentibacter saalensis TaxID=130788 RepID=UPI002B22111C|nr:DUF4367 domain-containing protein [Sedimentibacter saalensis]MEA5093638.1 DUF4367 domain-containing protein [Sedimentibacter saalensis]